MLQTSPSPISRGRKTSAPTNWSTQRSTPVSPKASRGGPPVITYLLLGSVFTGLLLCRIGFFLYQESRETLVDHIGEHAIVVGSVADEPDARATSLRIVVNVVSIEGAPTRGALLVLLPPHSAVAY